MKSLNYFIKEWIIPIIVALLIVVFLNKFIFILVTVPTGSMETTIMPGDKLYVTKIYNEENFERGDIIVFYSDELEKVLVKRLIGLPGDEVLIDEDGIVHVNGEEIDEPYAKNTSQNPQVFNVTEKSYFFMGDNRPNSLDARAWEQPYIPEDKVMGVALFRFFPFSRVGRIE
ncbi:signal peptidase I [Dethiosulfatibacter aminovorans DSM 17477]|uniref:Signal peptidase I n=1 Tax=Dethiosulfatibacter aminovorans DSM 17477 TaxID=1121476 RepID=A0A1M6CW86_9FIRM|nr:signal peptidase I [Dethiosulfatibacter aminovorans]SHI65074.1 signal peptidase I [Dethiosulfatibacter aminovorans DSM 17477]